MGEPWVPPRRMIGSANGTRIGITGLGVHVPDRVVTNDELAQHVDTSDEWIVERTGIHERRMAADDEALTDIALPAARAALADAAVDAADVDLLISATVTPDMMFPTTSALMADALGAPKAAAYDLLAGCTGFMYAVAQAYGMLASGLSRRALVVGGDVLSSILDWEDRSTLVLFGDGAGAVVMEPVSRGGFLGFDLGADGGGGENLWYPGSGSRNFENPDAILKMNGREVFKFATRIMVYSAEQLLPACGKTVADIDVYIPHQANKRIIDYAGEKISNQESLKRELRYIRRGHIWCFKLTNRTVIDAGVGGNIARFINHSCQPNCYIHIKDGIIWIRASRTIRKGEELSYHYNTDGSLDWGYFQINTVHLERPGLNLRDLLDCKANIDFAHQLYLEKGGFTPWSTFKNGRYRQFMAGQ